MPTQRVRCPACGGLVVFLAPEHTAAVSEAIEQPRPKRTLQRRPLAEGDMDLTPMVDVVFQLLIFFMVTASFKMQRSLEHPKPEDSESASASQSLQDFEDNPDYVIVKVDGFNTFHITASAFDDEIEAPSQQELLVKLRQARQGDAQGNKPSKMLVLADGDALNERVVMAIDSGNEVGIEEIQVMKVEGDDES
jgi:biopolymer transport protein ExbD